MYFDMNFLSECWRRSDDGGDPGLLGTNVLRLCIVQKYMYILILEKKKGCLLPNVLKDKICTMTMRLVGEFGLREWAVFTTRNPRLGFLTVFDIQNRPAGRHFFHYRRRVVVFIVSDCCRLLYWLSLESSFYKKQNLM